MRGEQFTIKSRQDRPSSFFASERQIIATYTLDEEYVTALTLIDDTTRKVLPGGYVVALDPSTNKVVPHYTTYGFGQVGVTLYDVDCGVDNAGYNYDRVIDVVWAGEIFEDHCWDNGTFGSVLNATKAALSPRISFVEVASSGKAGAKHFQ